MPSAEEEGPSSLTLRPPSTYMDIPPCRDRLDLGGPRCTVTVRLLHCYCTATVLLLQILEAFTPLDRRLQFGRAGSQAGNVKETCILGLAVVWVRDGCTVYRR
eukprot:274564-Prorocentrum_minimum.AAC.1